MRANWNQALSLMLACSVLGGCGSDLSQSQPDQTLTTTGAVNQAPASTPWLVVLCTPSDNTTVPAGFDANFYTRFFSPGKDSLADYWSNQSFGQMTIAGTVIAGQTSSSPV